MPSRAPKKREDLRKRRQPLRALHRGWLARFWPVAQQQIRRLDPLAPKDLEAELGREADPVTRARRVAELAAPADMKVLTTITHGLPAAVALTHHRPLTLISELAQRRLATVGVRAGEVVEHELSDRFQAALARWPGLLEPEPRPALLAAPDRELHAELIEPVSAAPGGQDPGPSSEPRRVLPRPADPEPPPRPSPPAPRLLPANAAHVERTEADVTHPGVAWFPPERGPLPPP